MWRMPPTLKTSAVEHFVYVEKEWVFVSRVGGIYSEGKQAAHISHR